MRYFEMGNTIEVKDMELKSYMREDFYGYPLIHLFIKLLDTNLVVTLNK